jgi:hypothetical protein
VDYQFYQNGAFMIFNIDAIGVAAQVQIPSPGVWYFIVGQHDGAGNYSMSLNDGTPATGFTGAPPESADPLFLGAGMGGVNPADGRMQNIFMLGRLLSGGERTFLYNGGNGRSYEELDDTLKTDLRAWWPLDEISGSRKDKHTFANHLTDTNTVGVADGKVFNPASGGALVARWADQSGLGNHLIQTVHNSRPHYKAVGKNGLPTLQFTGPPTANQLTTSAPLTIGTNFNVLLYEGSLPAADYYGFLSTAGTYLFIMYATQSYWLVGALTNIMRDEIATNYVDNLWHDYSGTGTPAEHAFLYLGVDRLISGRDWVGEAGEVLIYNTVLSAEDQALVRNYLRQKWGLP